MKLKSFTFIFLLNVILLGQDFENYSFYSLKWSGKDAGNEVVAKVGDKEISAKEFQLNYFYGPAFPKREKKSKQRYMNYLVQEKLLALEGYSLNLQADKEVKMILKEVEGDLATELLFRDKIWNKIQLSEEEINSAVNNSFKNIEMRWIFTKSEAEVVKLFDDVSKNNSFDSLYIAQFLDTNVKFDNRTSSSNYFKLSRDNPDLLKLIDTVKTGRILNPIKKQDGWYIIKVEYKGNNPLVTEKEWSDEKEKIYRILIQDKSDSASNIYVNNLIMDGNPIIIRKTLNLLRYGLAQKYLAPEKISSLDLGDSSRVTFKDLDKYASYDLVKGSKSRVTLQQFMDWYYTRTPYIKFDFSEHKLYDKSLIKIVWRMYRDYILTNQAEKLKYNLKSEVKEELSYWQDKLVFSRMKLQLSADIDTSENKVLEYYKNNLNKFRDDKGKVQDFDIVKDQVRIELYSDKYRAALVHKILSLKKKYGVIIDDKILSGIEVDDEENPKAIEVYPVKKGGTFPRVAFPSIDREWQFFE